MHKQIQMPRLQTNASYTTTSAQSEPSLSQPVQSTLDSLVVHATNIARISKQNQPVAQNTIFGWILYGEIPQIHSPSVNVNILTYHTEVEIDNTLRKFWELEEIPSARTISKADQWCETVFQQTHRRSDTGKYMVRLPFKTTEDSTAVLGTSMQTALRRFHLLNDLSEINNYISTIQRLSRNTKNCINLKTKILVTMTTLIYKAMLIAAICHIIQF